MMGPPAPRVRHPRPPERESVIARDSKEQSERECVAERADGERAWAEQREREKRKRE